MRSAVRSAGLVPPFSFQRSGLASRWRLAALVFCLLVVGLPAGGQQETDVQLLSIINTIKAVDNHSHGLPARDPARAVAAPTDPLGKSVPFFSVRQRETNPEWIEAWRTLYAYPYRDASPDHAREAFSAKRRLEQEKGTDYPSWILDQAGIEFALINASALGRGQAAPRFRWVPYADGFLFPFSSIDPTCSSALMPSPAPRFVGGKK